MPLSATEGAQTDHNDLAGSQEATRGDEALSLRLQVGTVCPCSISSFDI